MGRRRKYKEINLDQFKKIDNEDLAYVLGYLAWAGTYQDNDVQEALRISVSKKDRGHLDVLLKRLNADQKVYHTVVYPQNGKGYSRYFVSISQKGIVKALKQWYYRDNVDFKKFPPKMPKKYLSTYLQGYFERHGCVCKNHKTGYMSILSIAGPSLKFIKELKSCLEENGVYGSVQVNEYDNQRSTYRVRFLSIQMINLFEFLYQGDYSKGSRRKNNLMKAVEYWKPRRASIQRKNAIKWLLKFSKSDIKDLYLEQGYSFGEIAKEYDVSYDIMRKYIQEEIIVPDKNVGISREV